MKIIQTNENDIKQKKLYKLIIYITLYDIKWNKIQILKKINTMKNLQKQNQTIYMYIQLSQRL